jgi:hypothetical protein
MTRKQLVQALYRHRSVATVLESGEHNIINAYLTCEICGQSIDYKDFAPLLHRARNLPELNRSIHEFRAGVAPKHPKFNARCSRCGLPVEGK